MPDESLAGIDYQAGIHLSYEAGQSMPEETVKLWLDRFVAHSPARRPIDVCDLGCGTGRFCPGLASALGGLVWGVEPSAGMLEVARRLRSHSQVRYLAGSAEAIPLENESCGVVLMFLVYQHLVQPDVAALEVARVLEPGGRLLIGTRLAGQPTPRAWARYFPRANEIEEASLPTLAGTAAVMVPAGMSLVTHDRVDTVVSSSRQEYLERMRARAVSSFQFLTDRQFDDGLELLAAEVAQESQPRPVRQLADLLVFEKA